MLSGKLMWLIIVQLSFKGCHCLNSTQKPTEVFVLLNTTLPIEKTTNLEEETSFVGKTTEILVASTENPVFKEKSSLNSTNNDESNLEVVKIFHGEFNATNARPTEQFGADNRNHLIVTSVNSTNFEASWNDTFRTNYTTIAEATGSSDNASSFRLPNSAAIAAGVFLVSAVIGYISCVSYRRFLQRKYGNSQVLVGEDVYDTTDLRNFEI